MLKSVAIRGAAILLLMFGSGLHVFLCAYLADLAVGFSRTFKLGRMVAREISVPAGGKLRGQDSGRHFYAGIFEKAYAPRVIHDTALFFVVLGYLGFWAGALVYALLGKLPPAPLPALGVYLLIFVIPTCAIIWKFGQPYNPAKFFAFDKIYGETRRPGKRILAFLLMLGFYAGIFGLIWAWI
jgi:hypothetical protein